MPNDTVSAAAIGLPIVSRRLILGGILPAAAALSIPAVAAPIDPSTAWAAFVGTLAGRLPFDCTFRIHGGQDFCRTVVMAWRAELLHPSLGDQRMTVEHIVASYQVTADGWEDEGLHG